MVMSLSAALTLMLASLAAASQAPIPTPAPTPTPAPDATPSSRVAKPISAVLYATRGDNMIHALAGDDLRLLGSIEAGLGAHELALDQSGRFVMGSAYGGPGQGHQPADNRLVVIDLPAAKVHRTITLEGADRPNDIAFIAHQHNAGIAFEAWVTAEVPQQVLRVNADTGDVVKHAIDGKAGHMLALAPDAKDVYLAHVVPGTVNIIDSATGKVRASVGVPFGAEGIAVTPDGASLWVASNRSNKVSIIDTKEANVRETLDVPGFPFRVRCSPNGKWVAISCAQSANIALFDASDPKVVHRIDTNVYEGKPLAEQMVPTALAFSPDSASLYALCSGDKPAVVAIDVATRQLRGYVRCHGPIEDAMVAGMVLWSGA